MRHDPTTARFLDTINRLEAAERERDALREALRDMLDLHHPTGRWQEEGGLNEVVAMRLEAAHAALAGLEEA